MDVWAWIILYILVFALLQFVLYRYLHDDDSVPLSQSTPHNVEHGLVDDGLGEGRERTDPNVVRCPRCGTENDPAFTFCQNCVGPLGA